VNLPRPAGRLTLPVRLSYDVSRERKMTLLERLNGSGRTNGAHPEERERAKTVIVLGGDG
jgi:hypothetical protein